MDAYLADVLDHKRRVAHFLAESAALLTRRAVEHDNSKFEPEEYEAYAQVFPALQKTQYGSEEYKALLRQIKPAIQHHYASNRHHPEFYENGIAGMNIFDLLEMCCDWMAAMQRKNGHSWEQIETSLEINKQRFGIDDQLFAVIRNTLKLLRMM